MRTNNKIIARNAIYMYIRMLVMILVSLYTTRVVLETLGIDDYGLYNVVGSIVVFFSFINSGLAGATKRYILAELAVGDIESQRKVFSRTIDAHLFIIAIVIIAGETIGLWVLYHAMKIPDSRMYAALIVYQASLLTAVVGIMQSPFSSVIISYERMSIYAYLSILDVILKLGIVFVVRYIDGDKLIWYAILLSGIAIFDIVIYYSYCRSHFDLCRYVKSKDKATFSSILKYVGWTVFGSGANVLSKQGVNILVNNFFTVAVNAAMGISNMIVNVATQFVSNLQVVFAPQLTKNYISRDDVLLMRLLFQSSRYTSYLILIILIPITFVLSDILEIWLDTYPKYTEEFCILTLFCVYIESVSMPLVTIITAEKNIRNYQLYISFLYLCNFIICWLILFIGSLPYIVMIVRCVIDIVIVGVRLWLVRKKVECFSIIEWCKEVYFKSVFIMLLSVPLIFLFNFLPIESSFSRFITYGGISVLWVACIIYVIGFSKTERVYIINQLKKYTNVVH